MSTVKVTVQGLDAAKAAIDSLFASIQNPGAKLKSRLGDAMLEDVDQRFMTRGYGTWAPLKDETVKRKGHGHVLIDSGVMMASTEVAMRQNEVALTVRYGGKYHSLAVPGYHQQGTRRTPQRKIVEVTPQLTALLMEAIRVWVKDLVLAFGKKMSKK